MSSASRPYSILIIDDEVHRSLESLGSERENRVFDFGPLLNRLHKLQAQDEIGLRLCVAANVRLGARSATHFERNWDAGWDVVEGWRSLVQKDMAQHERLSLSEFDTLVLDLQGVGPGGPPRAQEEFGLTESDVIELNVHLSSYLGDTHANRSRDWTPSEVARRINKEYPGAAYYLRHFRPPKHLALLDAVLILTKYTQESKGYSAPPELVAYLEPFCTRQAEEKWSFTRQAEEKWSFPHTREFSSTESEWVEEAANLLEELVLDHTLNLAHVRGKGALQFAALHDLPVVIVGEPYTGRYQIASSITRRWLKQKVRIGEAALDEATCEPIQIRCAGLTEEQAYVDLFGRVENGAIMPGAIQKAASPKVANAEKEKADQEAEEDDISPRERWGAVYLHEFHELPGRARRALLRFLQDGTINPLGADDSQRVSKVRILVSTSHRAIAHYYGFSGKEAIHASIGEIDRLPVEGDLLIELKGQVLRAQRVTHENARALLKPMVKERIRQGGAEWDDSAYEAVEERIQELNTALSPKSDVPAPLLGQRKELERLVLLADVSVCSAKQCGIKDMPEKVTGEVIQRVWRAARVHANPRSRERWSENQLVSWMRDHHDVNPNYAEVIRLLYNRAKKGLRSGNIEGLQKSEIQKELDTGELKDVLSTLKKDFRAKVHEKEKKLNKDVPGKLANESGWFLKHERRRYSLIPTPK